MDTLKTDLEFWKIDAGVLPGACCWGASGHAGCDVTMTSRGAGSDDVTAAGTGGGNRTWLDVIDNNSSDNLTLVSGAFLFIICPEPCLVHAV